MADPNIGIEVKRLRARKGWSQLELSARADIGIASLKQIELGNQQPTLPTIYKLALAFETTPHQLLMSDWSIWKTENSGS